MIQRGSDQDAQVRRIFDALKVTPERLLDFQSAGRDAIFTVADKIKYYGYGCTQHELRTTHWRTQLARLSNRSLAQINP
jgi:hypothetical protein